MLGFMRVFRENRKFTIRVCYRVWYMLLVLVMLLCIYNIKGRANKSFFILCWTIRVCNCSILTTLSLTREWNHKRTIPPFYVCVLRISQYWFYWQNAKQAIEYFDNDIKCFNSLDERKIRKVEILGLVTNLLYLLVTGFESWTNKLNS